MSSCANASFAGCDRELRFDDVDARDELGDGVLDLDARVHLDEEELAVLIQNSKVPRREADPRARVDDDAAHA